MESVYKEVLFDKCCSKCKYSKKEESKDPCNECLSYGYNKNSSKPIYYEESVINETGIKKV